MAAGAIRFRQARANQFAHATRQFPIGGRFLGWMDFLFFLPPLRGLGRELDVVQGLRSPSANLPLATIVDPSGVMGECRMQDGKWGIRSKSMADGPEVGEDGLEQGLLEERDPR